MAETLPLFPLGTVLLPGVSLPLHVFEPRYRQLTLDVLSGAVPDKAFGVVAIRGGHDTQRPELHDVGCTAVLHEATTLPGGRFDIVTSGERRFRIRDIDDTSAPYLVATVEFLPDDDREPDPPIPQLVAAARAAHRLYCSTAWRDEDWDEPGTDSDERTLAHLIAADCLLPLEDRQELLEETRPADRLRLVRRVLSRETAFLRELRAVPVPFGQFATERALN